MTIQAPPDDLQVADYILSRLTSYLGNRPDYFSAFVDRAIEIAFPRNRRAVG